MVGSMWDSIKQLGEEATLHRYAGYASSAGHQMQYFHDAETVELVIRPWENDIGQQIDEGFTGQTPGKKVYAPEDLSLSRGDRLVYRGGAFQFMNPQYDQTFNFEKWDARTDDREFRLLSDAGIDESDLQEPDEGYGGY